jgi:4-hydroxy-tetrahydrodipicolinate synthase
MTIELIDAVDGVGVTPVTPFSEDLHAVDEAGLRSNLEYLVDAGVNLLYPCGNTGEFTSLGLDEWTRVVEIALDAAGDGAVVAPGVGHGLTTATEMLRRADRLGAAGALVMPPQPVYLSDRGLAAYYEALATSTELPLMVYRRDGRPSDETLARLAANGSIAGVKYGDTDINGFARGVAAAPGVAWTCGVAERYAPFFAGAGAVGFTSGLANFAPRTALAMHAALDAGDMDEALAVRERCAPFEEVRARHGSAYNVPAVKSAMDAVGLTGGRVRPPMIDLDQETRAEVTRIASTWEGR